MKNRQEYRHLQRQVKNILLNSRCYREFKMKLDLCGISMYNIYVLSTVRWVIFSQARFKSFRNKFLADVKLNIDSITPEGSVEEIVGAAIRFGKHDAPSTEFVNMIVKFWLGKHSNEFKT